MTLVPDETPRDISIHAPLARCDVAIKHDSAVFVISIHAPLARCDVGSAAAGIAKSISIHAPLARCDHQANLFE